MRDIDPYLFEKLNKQNQTIYENSNPKMSIQVTRAKTTVTDSSYWTVEEMRTKEGLGDLSVAARRTKATRSPNRLYNIYVDNGIVKTAIREYPDYQKNKWQDQFELGNGTAVAIAFDGSWGRYKKSWQLVTEENPFLFWIDNDGRLYSQLWDDVESKRELASDALKVKAIRGWKNVNFKDKDHGVIVAYIKNDGGIYYRNYCGQADGSFIWEYERKVEEFTGVAVNINLFLTNDFRTGFMVEDNLGKIHWIITERNWAGMGVSPDTFSVRAKSKIKLTSVKRKNLVNEDIFTVLPTAKTANKYALNINQFNSAINVEDEEGNLGVIVEFNLWRRVTELNTLDFELSDSRGRKFGCIEINEPTRQRFGWKYQAKFIDFNNAKDEVEISFKGVYGKNEVGGPIDAIKYTFSPINLVPTMIPLPEVELIENV